MISTTNYSLGDERVAADFLSIGIRELRKLRHQGKGPREVTLPNGDIRYRIEDLQAWALGGSNRVLHIYGGADVVPFPGSGVRVRKRLPPQQHRPSRALRRKPLTTGALAKICLECAECLSPWEVEFCTNVTSYRTLSPRQRKVLDRIIKKVHHYARPKDAR